MKTFFRCKVHLHLKSLNKVCSINSTNGNFLLILTQQSTRLREWCTVGTILRRCHRLSHLGSSYLPIDFYIPQLGLPEMNVIFTLVAAAEIERLDMEMYRFSFQNRMEFDNSQTLLHAFVFSPTISRWLMNTIVTGDGQLLHCKIRHDA